MNTSSSTTTGDQLRLARIRSGYSQAELATMIGVSQAAIGQRERGITSPRARRMTELTAAIDPLHSHATTNQPDEIRRAAAPPRPTSPTSPVLHELLAAEAIIIVMLGIMTTDQKLTIANVLEELGVAGEGATRFHERRAAITAAGAA